MSKRSKHLILNSDIRTWKLDQEVVFLGRWCLQRKNKKVWQNMKYEISPPLGFSKEDSEILLKEAREIEAKASQEFTDHVKETQEAMKLALKAKVQYESIKIWIELRRSVEATRRAEMKL